MNMASIRILALTVFTALCVSAEGLQISKLLTVQCKDEIVGRFGQQSLLECVVQIAHAEADAEINVVSWRKDGVEKPLLVFYNGTITTQQPGHKLAEPSWNKKTMNVSLLITNTMLDNSGSYTCMVMTSGGDGEGHTLLKVTARYSEPIIRSVPEKITGNADAELICDSVGGYPEGQIEWIVRGNKEWTKSSKMKAELAPDGLFRLTSTLTLLRGSIFPPYTCVVLNASGGKEAEAIFTTEPGEVERMIGVSTSKIVAPVVVIGSIIVGLMIVGLLIYKRRSQQARRPSTAPLMGDHEVVCDHDPDVEEGVDTTPQSSQI